MPILIRKLAQEDALLYQAIRMESLRESPLSFASSPEEDTARDLMEVANILAPSEDAFVLGVQSGAALVGIAGVFRQSPMKHGHKAFMWGVYIQPSCRGEGLGERLVMSAIEQAELMPGIEALCTSVYLTAPAARALYARTGFSSWGIEPRSARIGGQHVDEEHFVHFFSEPPRSLTGEKRDEA